jgi:hypothetical protein
VPDQEQQQLELLGGQGALAAADLDLPGRRVAAAVVWAAAAGWALVRLLGRRGR